MKYLIRAVIVSSACLAIGIHQGCTVKKADLAAWEEMQAVSKVDKYEQLPDLEKVRGDAEVQK